MIKTCRICGFKTNSIMKHTKKAHSHNRLHNRQSIPSKTVRILICKNTDCGYTTKDPSNMRRHYIEKHSDICNPRTCILCKETFTRGRVDWRRHIRICHSDVYKKVIAGEISLGCTGYQTFRDQTEAKYKCTFSTCERMFFSLQQRCKHLNQDHIGNGILLDDLDGGLLSIYDSIDGGPTEHADL